MEAKKSPWFLKHGRGMFEPEVLRGLRKYFSAREGEQYAGPLTERQKAAQKIGVASDALRMEPIWFDAWRNPTEHTWDTIGPYSWIISPPQVRHMRGAPALVPWHQDMADQRLLGPRAHKELITCWVPLDEEPSGRVTLQFCLDEIPEMEHLSMGAHGVVVETLESDNLALFELELGDCLLFGALTPHRTYVPPEAPVDRHSFEFRLIRPEEALDTKDYFDVGTGLFVRKDGSTRERI